MASADETPSEPLRAARSATKERQPSTGLSDDAREVLLEARGLTKRYGPWLAVDDVSFRVRRGELVGFLGPNGAGKSTTMRMLTGALHPDQGQALLAGQQVAGGPGGGVAARTRLGYLPEHTPLYPSMRVERYLAFVAGMRGVPRARRRDAVVRTVETCGLTHYARRRISELSKGYRQRVGLAQALIADPDVLILDEPTSGLDPAEIVRIRRLVRGLARDKTVLLSSHVLPEIEELGQRILILAAGRLVADGSVEELARESGLGLELVLGNASGAAEIVARKLAQVEGVADVVELETTPGGRLRMGMRAAERYVCAERVAALARDEGWDVAELAHRAASLETIFLERTRGLERRSVDGGRQGETQ